MTDKTPQNKADIPVKTPTARVGATDVTRNSGPESRALPEAGELKERFKAGSIPLQTDFADLIDLANMGRQAVGGAEEQTGPADGFTLSSMGRLELKPNTDKGISVGQDGVAIKLKTISGLTMDKDGISVKPKVDSGIELKDSAGISIKPGNGISVDDGGIAVKAEENKGLQVNNNGVSVKVGKGMRVNSTGMIEPDVGSYSLGIDEEGVEYAPVKVNTSTNGLVVDLHEGLINTSSGLSVNVGNGLQADHNEGVSLTPEQTFQKGMIMMFSGTSIPLGWALCDGNNGTPNLINRFIMGGDSTDVGGRSDNTFSGGNNSKKISFSTQQSSVDISGSTCGHSLTAEENGPHSHYAGIAVEHSSKCLNDYRYLSRNVDWLNAGGSGQDPDKYEPQVYPNGSGKAHSHNIKFTSGTHSHKGELTVPYYILAFIMKM